MKIARVVMGLFMIGSLALATDAQMFGGRPPSMRGVWKPVVGSGGVYELQTRREGKQEMEIAIVGTETVGGATGYWQEMKVNTREGETIMKYLYVVEGENMGMKRMIIQPPEMDPFEMDINNPMMGGRREQQPQ